jgi:2-polyprenyl-3-methyl-5-hydroxy-6-metoxy-1,4-benzoquinol methylase
VTSPGSDAEVQRIAAEYLRRDAAPTDEPSALDPATAYLLGTLDWEVLAILRRAGVALGGARVLDVGCGTGLLSHRLLELGAGEVTGVDLMEHRIALARERYPVPGLRFEQANAAELPHADGAFDLVTHFTCLSSVLDDDLRRAIAAQMWRVVRDGGAVLSYDLRPSPAPVRWAGRAATWLASRRGGGSPPHTPVRPLDLAELRALFAEAQITHRTAVLNVALAGVARRSRATADLLASLPPLRSHLLVLARKTVRP